MSENWINVDWLRLPQQIKDRFRTIIKTTEYTLERKVIIQSFEYINSLLKTQITETYKLEIEFQSDLQSSCEVFKLYNFTLTASNDDGR